MQTSKFQIAVLLAAVFGVAVADPIPSATAEAHYHAHFEGKPVGVYEWPERGILFAKVLVDRKKSGMDAEELASTRRVLRSWLAGRAAGQRADPVFPYGRNLVRETCRTFLPEFEYTANWNFSSDDTCAFTYERKNAREIVTVLWRDELLKSMPKAFLEPIEDGLWDVGLKQVVEKYYIRQKDLSFMWRIGALDAFLAVRTPGERFPELDGAMTVAGYFDEVRRAWAEVESPVQDEFADVWAQMVDYLSTSGRARGYLSSAIAATHPVPSVEMFFGPSSCIAKTNRVVVCTTNAVDTAQPTVRVSRFVQSFQSPTLPISVCSNQVTAVIEEQDVSVVQEVETLTIVRTRDRIVRRRTESNSGDPRFERLFLSGGCQANEPSPRTPSGMAAVEAFGAELGQEERESRILSALRENPGDADLWNYYGRLLQGANEHLGAIVCFRNALRLERCHAYALTNLARSYEALGKKRLACSMAMLASAVTDNAWCRTQTDAILTRSR